MTQDQRKAEVEKAAVKFFGVKCRHISNQGPTIFMEGAIAFALSREEKTAEECAKIVADPSIAPFQPGMLGGDTIPFVIRNHLAAAIRAHFQGEPEAKE